MRLRLTILILILTTSCSSQKNLIGLFGVCNSGNRGYLCQQVRFNSDTTFEFYNLIHLAGWTITTGKWGKNGDTIVLNSDRTFQINYKGISSNDSISITPIISGGPIPYSTISKDGVMYTIGESGSIKFPKNNLHFFSISYLGGQVNSIELDKSKSKTADSIEIIIDENFSRKLAMKNEKWILKGHKLFFPTQPGNIYNEKKFFNKTKISRLEYKKNYR